MYDLEKNFTHHPPKEGQSVMYKSLRDKAKYLASVIVDLTPESREQSLSLTKLEECVFWANAAIARDDPNTP